MTIRSKAAQALLDSLDADLARAAEKQGVSLSWTAAERQVLTMIADTVDRREDVAARYAKAKAKDDKIVVKLSQELRLLDAAVVRLLKSVETTVPEPLSPRSAKAQRAARARWDRAAG